MLIAFLACSATAFMPHALAPARFSTSTRQMGPLGVSGLKMAEVRLKTIQAVAAFDTSGVLKKMEIERRSVLANDVDIDIKFCGVCHSDLHHIRAEWPIEFAYPMVRETGSFSQWALHCANHDFIAGSETHVLGYLF
jgi:hypothetical protein